MAIKRQVDLEPTGEFVEAVLPKKRGRPPKRVVQEASVSVVDDLQVSQGVNNTVNKGGRPSDYTEEIAAAICAELSQGKSLRSVCAMEGMPSAPTIFSWMQKHEQFLKLYTRAKEESADAMAEEVLDIADDGTNDYMTITKGNKDYEIINGEAIQRSRLRVETRKWLMAKMKPKKYGDKIDHTTNGKDMPSPIISIDTTTQ